MRWRFNVVMRMMIPTLFVIQLYSVGFAASFDCADASSTLEKTICSDEELNKADEYMAQYYFKLKESLNTKESKKLLNAQRAWLKLRTTECAADDSSCLKKLYHDRIHALRQRYENLVPFTFPGEESLQGFRSECGFAELSFPDDFSVYATGWYGGRPLDVQLKQGGGPATQFDIVVNSPQKPVVLILGAYKASIWNIGWTKGTHIVAVLATGYHRQAVAGLPKETPMLISTHENRGPCGYLYVSEKKLSELNPLSQRVFNKPVDMVYYAKAGKAVVGQPISQGEQLFTSSDTPLESFVDTTLPRPGDAGLSDALAQGLIRPVTRQDLEAWAQRKAELAPKDTVPPVADGDSREAFMPRNVHNGFVILKKFHVPPGLYGGHSATFFLLEGVPYPEGELGHSTLYDFNTMTCRGVGCPQH